MENHFESLKLVIDENASLRERLKDVTEKNRRLDKKIQKKQINFLNHTPFLEKNEKFADLDSTFNNKHQNEAVKAKLALIKEKIHQEELKSCSFVPAINPTSLEMVENSNYIPVHKRPLPKNEIKITQVAINAPFNYNSEPKSAKKLDPNFYKNQLDWKTQIEKQDEGKRKNKEDIEMKEAIFVPIKTQEFKKNMIEQKKGIVDQSAKINDTSTERAKYKGKSKSKKLELKKKSKLVYTNNSKDLEQNNVQSRSNSKNKTKKRLYLKKKEKNAENEDFKNDTLKNEDDKKEIFLGNEELTSSPIEYMNDVYSDDRPKQLKVHAINEGLLLNDQDINIKNAHQKVELIDEYVEDYVNLKEDHDLENIVIDNKKEEKVDKNEEIVNNNECQKPNETLNLKHEEFVDQKHTFEENVVLTDLDNNSKELENKQVDNNEAQNENKSKKSLKIEENSLSKESENNFISEKIALEHKLDEITTEENILHQNIDIDQNEDLKKLPEENEVKIDESQLAKDHLVIISLQKEDEILNLEINKALPVENYHEKGSKASIELSNQLLAESEIFLEEEPVRMATLIAQGIEKKVADVIYVPENSAHVHVEEKIEESEKEITENETKINENIIESEKNLENNHENQKNAGSNADLDNFEE